MARTSKTKPIGDKATSSGAVADAADDASTPSRTVKRAGAKAQKAKPQKVAALAKSKSGASRKNFSSSGTVNTPRSEVPKKAVKSAPLKKGAVKAGGASKVVANSKRGAPGHSSTEQATAPSITELKEVIMATQMKDYTETMTDQMNEAVNDMQDRSKAAYDKSTEMMSEMSDFAKGTAEAMVESTKILAGAMQDMGKTYADEAKSAYEQMTADLKEMAAVKNPTELFQLQGKIMRRNFDALVSTTSKNAEMLMKLSNDAFAPLSARMNVAAEKMNKVS